MNQLFFSKERPLSETEKRNLAVLEALRRAGPATKMDISRMAGLNIVTVSNYINELITKKIVLERELATSTGGRRPLLVELNPKAGFLLGVGVNLFNVVGLLTDLKGEIITKVKRAKTAPEVDKVVTQLVEVIEELIGRSGLETERIKGIGIGIAGIVSGDGNAIRYPAQMGKIYTSIYMPLRHLLEREFRIPTLVENDATAAAFGELWMGLEPEVSSLLYMFSGVGLGIVIDGVVYRGITGGAGEVSIDYSPHDEQILKCPVIEPCILKRWRADLGMVEYARKAIQGGRDSQIAKLANQHLNKITPKAIFKAARMGDELAIQIEKEAGRKLGLKAAFLINLLNPQVVIIGGGIEEAGAALLDGVKKTVDECSFEEMAKAARIIYSRLGENSVALGAASIVAREVFART